MSDFTRRLKYMSWAAQKCMTDRDRSCPACQGQGVLVRRKFLVLSLMECRSCGLRFRFPKDDATVTEYYETSYSVDYPAQQPPTPESLAQITHEGVLNHPANNYANYAKVLKASGLKPGSTVLDFGCSWGYGSWQLREAGFVVYSMEVSKPRADYARNSMGCTMVNDISEIPERVQCFFSAHVIEHLPDPTLIWKEADKALANDGKMIIFCPNGEPRREAVIGRRRYGYLWPQVHPMVITPDFMRSVSGKYGFRVQFYSEPYDLASIADSGEASNLLGDELLLVAHRRPERAP